MSKFEVMLQAKGLKKIFSGKEPFLAVDGVSFSIRAGEVLGLLGPNGAGKSTTIQMLLGALKPSAGSVSYFGMDLSKHRSAILERVGYASGYSRMPWNLTVWENLEVHGRMYGLPAKERRQRIDEFIERFGLEAHRNKIAGRLSAGQTTRLMLIRAFLHRPSVVLLDEPTASLDPDICEEILIFVKDQVRRYQVSMLYTSHNMDEVAEICDRVVFLKGGRVVAEDTPAALAATAAEATLRLNVQSGREELFRWLKRRQLAIREDRSWVEITTESAEVGQLISDLVASGAGFADVEIRKPTLEDYFLRLARQEGNFYEAA